MEDLIKEGKVCEKALLGWCCKSEDGAGAVCLPASPNYVPMRVLAPVGCLMVSYAWRTFFLQCLEKSLRGFFLPIFLTYQGQKDCAAAFNPPRICTEPHIAAGDVADASPFSSGISWMAANASLPSLTTTRGGWSRARGSICGQLYEFPITSLPCHCMRGSCT